MGRGRKKRSVMPKKVTVQTSERKKQKRQRKRQPDRNREKLSKHIKGSPERISRSLMKEMLVETVRTANGRYKAKVSRYAAKTQALETLKESGKPRDPASVAKLMPVYSARTRDGYQKTWKMFFTHVRENYGVNDVTKVKSWHVEEFMRETIDREVSFSTYKTYSAAMSKLEVALNKVLVYPISFDTKLKQMNKEAKGNLVTKSLRRAYVDPAAAIANVADLKYRIAALLQLEGGARISEVSELTADRNLRGIRNGVGYIKLTNTKGGRVRTMKVSADLYKDVQDIIKAEGRFEYNKRNYGRALSKSFESRGEDWNGTHGLRWNFAQRRFYELQSEEAKTFKEALQLVSFELGHSRPSITLHYLQ